MIPAAGRLGGAHLRVSRGATHAITGGGERATQGYSIPAQPGLRLALATFVNPTDAPGATVARDDQAVLIAVE